MPDLTAGLNLTGQSPAPRPANRRSQAHPERPQAIANRVVPITDACRLIGISVYGISNGSSAKLQCPWAEIWHSDGGYAKSFRIYENTNSCFCFACSMVFSPVSLYALYHDLTHHDAAVQLLDVVGYTALNLHATWEDVLTKPDEVDHQALIQALTLYCARVCPDWPERQFDERVSRIMLTCFKLVDKVASGEDSARWLSATQAAMSQALMSEERDQQ